MAEEQVPVGVPREIESDMPDALKVSRLFLRLHVPLLASRCQSLRDTIHSFLFSLSRSLARSLFLSARPCFTLDCLLPVSLSLARSLAFPLSFMTSPRRFFRKHRKCPPLPRTWSCRARRSGTCGRRKPRRARRRLRPSGRLRLRSSTRYSSLDPG